MENAQALVAGYTAYTNADEFGATAMAEPGQATWTIVTASSPECAAFSVGATAASVAGTVNWGC
jgi:hypothetical protein